jgi:hypothetical protein
MATSGVPMFAVTGLPDSAFTACPEISERGHGPAPHLVLVQHVQRRPPAIDLPAEVQVGRRVQVRGERQVLVHGLDAVRPGVERAAEAHRAALDEDLP